MQRQIVTVAGSPGSGKSATAKAVAARRGESIEAANISAEIQRDIDLEVDRELQEMYAAEEGIVIDSRMAWRWMPQSFKIFLVLDAETAAVRIFGQLRREGRRSEDAQTVEEVRRSIARRFASERKRYKALYGVDFTEPLNFDLVVNTRDNDLATVTQIVEAAFRAWRGSANP